VIDTLSDLLTGFRDKELQLIKKYEIIDHPVMIGDMYEGLTKNILSKSLFAGLDLRVVSGKITNSEGSFSSQIDCMLVEGEGDHIPYTEDFIYDHSQVVAVIEVKKTLYSSEISDAYDNLRSVVDVSEPIDGSSYHTKMLRDAYRMILRKGLPERSELAKLPMEEQMIYHILISEVFLPLRVVWGYYGFKSEYKLRESFNAYLRENSTTDFNVPITGYGPSNLPSLIMCNKHCLLKNNGMPYGTPLIDEYWPVYLSTSGNPIMCFLEYIWTRLSYKYNLSSDIFGDDLELTAVNRFIDCRLIKKSGKTGWEYNYLEIPKGELEIPMEPKQWQPAFIDENQYAVFIVLCNQGQINIYEDQGFKKFLESKGIEMKDFIQRLIDTGLVYLKDGNLMLLTDHCMLGFSEDGRIFAGEDKDGRVTRWLLKQKAQGLNGE
jgi:hypothetical protein